MMILPTEITLSPNILAGTKLTAQVFPDASVDSYQSIVLRQYLLGQDKYGESSADSYQSIVLR